MWDLDTIKTMNASTADDTKYARVFALGDGKYALGNRGRRALYVVKRVLAHGRRGRPSYIGVRGVRPYISPEFVAIKPSKLLRTALIGGLN